jgi:hypothetical protein
MSMLAALKSFQQEIARIDEVANWLASPHALTSQMAPATWAIRCGSVVLLSGYLENFLKDCMAAFITQVNALGKPLSKLPVDMKYTHFEYGARALGKQLKKDKKLGNTALCEDLAVRLASVNTSTGYTLAWEAFAETQANPGPIVIGGLLSAVGVNHPWKQLKASTPSGLGDLELFLTTFIEMRNECAHSGNTTSPPTASELLQYVQNFAGLGQAMITVLDSRLIAMSHL